MSIINVKKRRVLISLDDTTGVVAVAVRLIACGWEIIATDETRTILESNSIPVTPIGVFTRLDGEFQIPPTLHPAIEEALTFETDKRIDMVYVIPYGLEKGNDIGGRTLLALACKGQRIPLMCSDDMNRTLDMIELYGDVSDKFRLHLIAKTCERIANHYMELCRQGVRNSGEADDGEQEVLFASQSWKLQNGENPYQEPANLFSFNGFDKLAIDSFEQVSGVRPCYTNIADCDNLLQTLCLLSCAFDINTSSTPYICIAAKHGNPCGLAISRDTPLEAVSGALFGNPQAVWGGEVITNFPVDGVTGEALFTSEKREELFGSSHWMLDVIMAPNFSDDAVAILGKSKRRKLLQNSNLEEPFLVQERCLRGVRGGYLRQPMNNYIVDIGKSDIVSEQLDSLLIAWAVAWNSFHGGNEIALAKDRRLLAAGGGPSTLEAVYCAVERAQRVGHDLKASVFAANAFFPFTDAPEVLAESLCAVGLTPSGGKNEDLVRNFFTEKNIDMVFIGSEYRGFSRH